MVDKNTASIAGAAPSPKLSAMQAIKAVKGMNDILPPDSARWEWLEDKVRSLMARYAYRNIRTPIVEPTALFVRSLGEVTDIVEKEMYSFEDRLNAEQLTLRGPDIANEFHRLVETYIEKRFGNSNVAEAA